MPATVLIRVIRFYRYAVITLSAALNSVSVKLLFSLLGSKVSREVNQQSQEPRAK